MLERFRWFRGLTRTNASENRQEKLGQIRKHSVGMNITRCKGRRILAFSFSTEPAYQAEASPAALLGLCVFIRKGNPDSTERQSF